MKNFAAATLITALVSVSTDGVAAPQPQPIDAFARLPRIRNVTISADGGRIAFITAMDDDRSLAVVADSSLLCGKWT